MRSLPFRRPSPGTTLAFVALTAALSGTAIALPGTNSVDSGDIKNKQVKRTDLANNAVTSSKVKDGSLRSKDFKAGQLPAGPKGDKGDKGSPGVPGTSIFPSSIPSGTTVAGGWGGRYIAPQLAGNNTYLISTSFPVKAPAPLSDATVNVAPNAAAGDPDPTCTGSSDNPTAPSGKVCIYISRTDNAGVTGFRLTNPGVSGSAPGDAYGFIVRILDAGTVGPTATTNAEGTWAYTAP